MLVFLDTSNQEFKIYNSYEEVSKFLKLIIYDMVTSDAPEHTRDRYNLYRPIYMCDLCKESTLSANLVSIIEDVIKTVLDMENIILTNTVSNWLSPPAVFLGNGTNNTNMSYFKQLIQEYMPYKSILEINGFTLYERPKGVFSLGLKASVVYEKDNKILFDRIYRHYNIHSILSDLS